MDVKTLSVHGSQFTVKKGESSQYVKMTRDTSGVRCHAELASASGLWTAA